MPSIRIRALIVLLALGAPHPARAEPSGPTAIWDAKDTAQAGQLTIYNTDENGSLLGMPVASADLDGDGFDDVVLAPMYAPSGPGGSRLAGGRLHVYFGEAGALSGAIVDEASAPERSVDVWGARKGDFLGNEVAAGDVTGDGLADVLAGAENADGFDDSADRSQAGALYIIPGRSEWPARIDLANPQGVGVTQVLGAHAGDRLGFWVAVGDVTGDGVGDVLVSADLAKGPSGGESVPGVLYIIPGRPSFPSRIDLGDASQVRSLGIVTVYGIDDKDHFGSSIAAGDVDGDGIEDVVTSAGVSRAGASFIDYGTSSGGIGQGGGDGPGNDRADAGEVYVIYGRANWPATINLASPPPDVGVYYGEDGAGYFGEDVDTGDVDGDGKAEVAVGALLADAPGRANSGVGYVLWGAEMRRGERLDLRSAGAASERVTRLYGERANDIGADSLRLADVDGDGLADALFGSPNNTPSRRDTAGDLKVLYGTPGRFPGVVDLAAPPAEVPVFQVVAPDPGDLFTYSFATGDVDGDGIADLIPNAMGGDGVGNLHELAGECYVISGRSFSGRAGRGALGTPCVSRVVVTPTAKRYYAGQAGIELAIYCDSTDPAQHFKPGAVALLRGVEVPTTFVGPNEVRVRLDDAPEVRNQAGSIAVQVRNAESDPSSAVLSITLAGPTIRKAKAKEETSGFVITVSGKNFLDGVTASVVDAEGIELRISSVERVSSKKLRVHVTDGTSGDQVTLRVLNPGPAPSNAFALLIP